jgi:segregation and condensation protein A
MAYKIKLDIFEGPFDLLLFLIKKDEVDIYDIPIHDVTNQFLEYIELMKILDLEIAGEFIEMVAILMRIKARMLLPKPAHLTDEEYEDPRTELVEKLIAYKQFKDAAADMSQFEDQRRKHFTRMFFMMSSPEPGVSNEEYLENVTLFDLLLAFKKALDAMPKITHHEVRRIEVTVEQQQQYILGKITPNAIVLFQELMTEIKERIVIIVTFIALLEMIKSRQIEVRQTELFGDIRIKLRS